MSFLEIEKRNVWPGMEIVFSSNDIQRSSEWRICNPRHLFIVHLGGRMDALETELEGHGGSSGPAIPGEVWSVPAQRPYVSRMRGGAIQYAALYLDATREIVPVAGVRDDFLHQAMRQLALALGEGKDTGEMFAQTLGHAVHLYLHRTYGQSRVFSKKANAPALPIGTARRLREYVFENLAGRITLGDLAGIAGMTDHHLLIAFRKAFGATPWQYVIAQRVRCAQRLLAQTRRGITEIALEAGFSSHSHLTSVFTQRVGCSPKEFRGQGNARLAAINF